MALQILPVRQAVKYFFIDNQTVEEMAHVEKSASKNFRLLVDDHKYLPATDYLSRHFTIAETCYPFPSAILIPPFHSVDVLTPPPNKI